MSERCRITGCDNEATTTLTMRRPSPDSIDGEELTVPICLEHPEIQSGVTAGFSIGRDQ